MPVYTDGYPPSEVPPPPATSPNRPSRRLVVVVEGVAPGRAGVKTHVPPPPPPPTNFKIRGGGGALTPPPPPLYFWATRGGTAEVGDQSFLRPLAARTSNPPHPPPPPYAGYCRSRLPSLSVRRVSPLIGKTVNHWSGSQ